MKDFENLKIGDILMLKGTKNFDVTENTWVYIFETETNYSGEILHGEAVAIGMVMAAKMSEKLGVELRHGVVRKINES